MAANIARFCIVVGRNYMVVDLSKWCIYKFVTDIYVGQQLQGCTCTLISWPPSLCLFGWAYVSPWSNYEVLIFGCVWWRMYTLRPVMRPHLSGCLNCISGHHFLLQHFNWPVIVEHLSSLGAVVQMYRARLVITGSLVWTHSGGGGGGGGGMFHHKFHLARASLAWTMCIKVA